MQWEKEFKILRMTTEQYIACERAAKQLQDGEVPMKNFPISMKPAFRSIDYVCRIGGDEFCVLAQNTSEGAIHECINLMLQSLKKTREADTIMPIISYGYSIYSKGEQRDILLSFQEADKKMYTCKKNRRIEFLL